MAFNTWYSYLPEVPDSPLFGSYLAYKVPFVVGFQNFEHLFSQTLT